jgi:hypothetical protein
MTVPDERTVQTPLSKAYTGGLLSVDWIRRLR